MSSDQGNQPVNGSQEDLGLGRNVSKELSRIINEHGSFNIKRIGYRGASWYHKLIEMSWLSFLLLIFIFYGLVNSIFGTLYYLVGPDQINGLVLGDPWFEFFQCFFFSVQSFTTVGYGGLHPTGVFASTISGVEALSGLLTFAIITGLVYAKFSKPKSKILFSKNILIAPYKEGMSFQIRTANAINNIILDLEATLICSILPKEANIPIIRTVPLEISKISMYPLNWTVVHAFNEKSPFYNFSQKEFETTPIELLLLLRGYDESYNQQSYAVHSYTNEEFIFNAKFKPMYFSESSKTILNLSLINEFEKLN